MAAQQTADGVATATIIIGTEMIRLGQFLKMANLAGTGGEAKLRIQQGEVKVNGAVERQRGRQLRAGDVVELDGQTLQIRQQRDQANSSTP